MFLKLGICFLIPLVFIVILLKQVLSEIEEQKKDKEKKEDFNKRIREIYGNN